MHRRNRRLLEWCLLMLVVVLVVVGLNQQFRVVRGQGELAAIKTTLGALRTALVIDHMKAALADRLSKASATPVNPFLLLSHVPATYAGELQHLQGQPVPSGSWVFDPYCRCVGYQPLSIESLDAGVAPFTLWFAIEDTAPLQISPIKTYHWQGELIN